MNLDSWSDVHIKMKMSLYTSQQGLSAIGRFGSIGRGKKAPRRHCHCLHLASHDERDIPLKRWCCFVSRRLDVGYVGMVPCGLDESIHG